MTWETNSKYFVKVTDICSWICHKPACITFPPKKLPGFYNNQSQQRVFSCSLAYSKFATVHSWVTVGGCSMEFEYNFLCQFARTVARRMPYISVLSICMASLQGHTKSFWKKKISVNRCLFSKSLGTHFLSIQEPFSHCCSVLFWDTSKNVLCGPVVSCSGSV